MWQTLRRFIRVFFPLLLSYQTSWAEETIRVSPGHQSVIAAPGIRRAAIGNPTVADVKVLSKAEQVIVTGSQNGSTDLILWFKSGSKKNYSILVSSGGRSVEDEIRKLLGDMEGVTLRHSGGKIVLDGQIYRGQDLLRLRKITEMYPGAVNLARVNGQVLSYLADEIVRSLRAAGIHTVQAREAGDTLILEGDVSSDADFELTGKVAASIYGKVSNHVRKGVTIEPLVLVDVKMMEVRKKALSEVGLKWPGSLEATGNWTLTSAGSTGLLSVGQGASMSLQSLIEKGVARVLANPKLLCRSGTPASFLAGGEIPIRLVGERTAQVTFKQYGISLEMTAHTDRSKQVLLEIETKVSDLDPANAVDGIPGFLENRVKTAANLFLGDTIVLAGLIENRSRKNVQKVPFLGHIPILGELFKSRSFQESESEFLVFLTPLRANPPDPAHGENIKKMKEKAKNTSKELEFSILD